MNISMSEPKVQQAARPGCRRKRINDRADRAREVPVL